MHHKVALVVIVLLGVLAEWFFVAYEPPPKLSSSLWCKSGFRWGDFVKHPQSFFLNLRHGDGDA
jgi:hypothetical protein